jgi:non-canonical poly(A) RNA polymerase PAPD5/7
MHDRSNNVHLHDRFLLRRTPTQFDQRLICPPWRHTQIPVELFDLMTPPPSMSVRLYRLHFEILQFYHFMIPTEGEHTVRQQVINRITDVINHYLPTASVDVYGSYKTGLYLPMSDIDLIVHSKDGRQWNAEELESLMNVLREAFCRHRICTEDGIQILNGATVPIIKLTDRKTDVKVDMSFNMNNGLRNAQLILHYMQEYPYLKYLVYILKQYLLQLNLNEVWTGGISSYSLILMLVCFFQCYYKKDQYPIRSFYLFGLSTSSTTTTKTNTTEDCSPSTSYPSSSAASCISSDENNTSDIDDDHASKHVNLGHMLISFLELYGVYFNYAKLGIRVQTPYQPDRPAGFIDKEELFKNFCCGHRTINNLCIVDPFNDKNDISKASWLTPKLNSAFREAYDKLLQSISEQNTTLKNAPSILSKILTVSENTLLYRKELRRIYREYQNEQRTVKHIQYGRLNYTSLDKQLIQYTNGNPLKYPYHLPYQQQFFSSQKAFHRPQTQRTNHQRTVIDDEHRNAQE